METVVVVDTKDNTYRSHHNFASLAEARSFAEGMEAAWEISHGWWNCWRPLALGDKLQRQEWIDMGSPGKQEIGE